MSAVFIRLPDDVSARLQDLAQITGRSKTFYMYSPYQASFHFLPLDENWMLKPFFSINILMSSRE